MITRKEIAVLYRCDYEKISELLVRFKIVDDKKGKGKRTTLLPIEFEMLKKHIGEPIKF